MPIAASISLPSFMTKKWFTILSNTFKNVLHHVCWYSLWCYNLRNRWNFLKIEYLKHGTWLLQDSNSRIDKFYIPLKKSIDFIFKQKECCKFHIKLSRSEWGNSKLDQQRGGEKNGWTFVIFTGFYSNERNYFYQQSLSFHMT